MLRANQLCGLKFRRQHPISRWITDFACVEKMLVVEIDGGCHDETNEADIDRQQQIEKLGWTVIRFTDKDVEEDAEVVARAIARKLQLPYEYARRKKTGAGMMALRENKN